MSHNETIASTNRRLLFQVFRLMPDVDQKQVARIVSQ